MGTRTPQLWAVSVGSPKCPELSVAEIDRSTGRLHVFLLICGLRHVKDPLYLVDAFAGMCV